MLKKDMICSGVRAETIQHNCGDVSKKITLRIILSAEPTLVIVLVIEQTHDPDRMDLELDVPRDLS